MIWLGLALDYFAVVGAEADPDRARDIQSNMRRCSTFPWVRRADTPAGTRIQPWFLVSLPG